MRLTTTRGRPRSTPIASSLIAGLVMATVAGPGCPARARQIRCWLDKGALVAPAAFGDIAGDFLIDPGTPTSQLHVTRAQLDGLDVASVTRDLVLAGRRVGDLTMQVVDLDARTGHFDTTINGVVGADVLGRFVLDIDFAPCRLTLLPRRRVAAPPRVGSTRLEVHVVAGRPLVAARITDGVTARSGLFAIDTGDWASGISGAALSLPAPAAGAPAPPIRLRGLEVADRLFEQVPAAIDTAAPEAEAAAGAIGLSVWSHWRLRLDMAGGWMELAPAAPPAGQ